MKTYKNPTMEIRNFISEDIITTSLTEPDTLAEWQAQNTNNKVVNKQINAMKVMEYTF